MHPDTGEMIPRPFRMGGYVLYNAPALAGTVLATSTPSMMLMNWFNQSHNAAINYYNMNKSTPTSNEVVVQSYLGAVGAALTVALTKLLQDRPTIILACAAG